MFQIYTYTFFLLFMEFSSTSSSINKFVDPKHSNETLIVLNDMKETYLRSEGIFVRFLSNLLELLTTKFPEKKLPKYCRTVGRYVDQLNYRYAKKLAKHLRQMSRMYRDEIKSELIFFKEELVKKKPYQYDFLEAMNNIFTLQEHIRFDDYIYELKNYGNDDVLFIDKETEKLVNDVIMKSIMRQSSKDRSELQKKLKNAVKEFKYDWSWD